MTLNTTDFPKEIFMIFHLGVSNIYKFILYVLTNYRFIYLDQDKLSIDRISRIGTIFHTKSVKNTWSTANGGREEISHNYQSSYSFTKKNNLTYIKMRINFTLSSWY